MINRAQLGTKGYVYIIGDNAKKTYKNENGKSRPFWRGELTTKKPKRKKKSKPVVKSEGSKDKPIEISESPENSVSILVKEPEYAKFLENDILEDSRMRGTGAGERSLLNVFKK